MARSPEETKCMDLRVSPRLHALNKHKEEGSMRGITLFAVALSAMLVSCGACDDRCVGAQSGGSCDWEAEECCEDPTSLLWCKNGIWQQYSCPGPLGCFNFTEQWVCDFNNSKIGDPCPYSDSQPQGWCTIDGSIVLRCKDGQFFSSEKCPLGKSCSRNVNGTVGCW